MSITGYGKTGPKSMDAGHDLNLNNLDLFNCKKILVFEGRIFEYFGSNKTSSKVNFISSSILISF